MPSNSNESNVLENVSAEAILQTESTSFVPHVANVLNTSNVGVVCPSCQSTNEAGSIFCYSCGGELPPQAQTAASKDATSEMPSNSNESNVLENVSAEAIPEVKKSPYIPQVVNIPNPSYVAQEQKQVSRPMVNQPISMTPPVIPAYVPPPAPGALFNYPIQDSSEVSMYYNSGARFIEGQYGVLSFVLCSIKKQLFAAKGFLNVKVGDSWVNNVELVGSQSSSGLKLYGSIQIPMGISGQIIVDGVVYVWFDKEASEVRYKVPLHTYIVNAAKGSTVEQINIAIDQSGNSGLIHGNNSVYIPGLESLNNDSRQENAYGKENWTLLEDISKIDNPKTVSSIALVENDNNYVIINTFEDDSFIAGRSTKLKGINFCVRHVDENMCNCLSGKHIQFKLKNDAVEVIETSTNGAHFVGGKNNPSPNSSIGEILLGKIRSIRCTRSRCSVERLVDLKVVLFKDIHSVSKCGGIGLIVAPESKKEGWCSRSDVHLNILPGKTISIDMLLDLQGDNEISNKNGSFLYSKGRGNWVSLREGDKISFAGKDLTVKFIS
ncbi:MAG: hypothetical protein J6V70_08205, partial [Kiritimatiellae bacterium]|nr:hypothetical protein [Kiritimatiellia bacterium]